MSNSCQHCQKLKNLYPEREYNPMDHLKQNCPILAETKCYNCGKPGHTPKYCNLPKTKCLRCGRIGHTTELCDTENNNIKEFDKSPTSWIFMNHQEMDFESIE